MDAKASLYKNNAKIKNRAHIATTTAKRTENAPPWPHKRIVNLHTEHIDISIWNIPLHGRGQKYPHQRNHWTKRRRCKHPSTGWCKHPSTCSTHLPINAWKIMFRCSYCPLREKADPRLGWTRRRRGVEDETYVIIGRVWWIQGDTNKIHRGGKERPSHQGESDSGTKNKIKSHPQRAGESQKEKSRGESERNKVNGREEGNEIRRRPPLLRWPSTPEKPRDERGAMLVGMGRVGAHGS